MIDVSNDKPARSAPLSWLTLQQLLLALSVISLGAIIFGTCVLYSTSGPLPPPRDPPPLPEKSAVTSYRYKEGFYRSIVEEDAKKLKLAGDAASSMKRVNQYYVEFTGNQRLKPGGLLETTHLKMQVLMQRIWVGDEGQGYRTEHLVLKITNKTEKHLAYRVVTRVSGRCGKKGILSHNAIALAPQETISRTECLFNEAGPVRVARVEVMEISPLGYFYVGRLDPLRLQFDRRTAEGHTLGVGLPLCTLLPSREIDAALRRDEIKWYDVIDFYSRHSCDEYTFFVGYGRLDRPPKTLPIKPPGIEG